MLIGTGEGIEQRGFPRSSDCPPKRKSYRFLLPDLNPLGVLPADGQLISPDLNLNGVPHGRHLLNPDPGLRNESHVQQPEPQGPLAADGGDDRFVQFSNRSAS